MYCDMDEIAAVIDVVLVKNSKINLQKTIDDIWALRNSKSLATFGPVTIEAIGAAFGDADVVVNMKTKLAAVNGYHPTWRIAQFVQEIFNMDTVARTNTRIIVHDEHHDLRRPGTKGRAPKRSARRRVASR
jgi:hypothetical protein